LGYVAISFEEIDGRFEIALIEPVLFDFCFEISDLNIELCTLYLSFVANIDQLVILCITLKQHISRLFKRFLPFRILFDFVIQVSVALG
jgi:hypothetical protein